MCGIVTMWGHADESWIKVMSDLLVHRGPDADGMHLAEDRKVGLGHRRLSIMDPEGGDQPIASEDGNLLVIANGEIYNFPKLLEQLSEKHTFKTTSDSEVLLHLYEDYGDRVVDHLDGMYAFALTDNRDVYLARDPIGIKPLYFGTRDDNLVFSSELKSISSYCREIKEFPPGAFFHSQTGLKTFYSVPELKPKTAPVEDYIRALRKTLTASVVKRLMSDVPLGTFLSGGLDSSLISAIARRHMDELHTFSVGIEGSRDLEAARVVSRHLDTRHHEYILTREEVKEKLIDIIYYLESYDQDLVRSAIPCYFTSRLASDYVKVILTGEGADELFAGYTYYKDIDAQDSLHRELRRSIASLHNINLQRVDRMTMAQSIEGRVPFLDLEMIKLGQLIPPEMKLNGSPPVEKWILRTAFEDHLPEEIIWRDKEQFDEGSGTVDLLAGILEDVMSEEEFHEYKKSHPDAGLRSPEEAYYHRLFLEAFENADAILANVARWAERPDYN